MIKRNHGHVVTIASVASFAVLAGNVDYSCTKAAALAFHEGLTQELRHRYHADRVRTTFLPLTDCVVHPTWVRTPLIAELLAPNFNGLVLEAETVADAVVKQVLKGESAQLILPSHYSLLASLRGFPSWLQEGVRSSHAGVLDRSKH
ncbi:hypothetical protein VTN77DRAFT_2915 [Rasamsonia byssochlamydoides]|uniref:uncharacterized protein n=1 Tax=Rasamsonia byssochlamydoides TaxID=89139 RepID=UPI0037441221